MEENMEICKDILSELTGIDKSEINSESSLIEELGIESFDLADLNFKIKEVFGLDSDKDFLSVEGIIGNPNFIDEDNRLKPEGVKEFEKRIPGITLPENAGEQGIPIIDILNNVKVKDMFSYVEFNKSNKSIDAKTK